MEMEGPVQQAMRVVSEALALDGDDKFKEAYLKYLQCLHLVVDSLLRDACKQTILGPGTPQRLIKLGQQCFERVGSLVDTVSNLYTGGSSVSRAGEGMSDGCVSSPLSPHAPSSTPLVPSTPHTPSSPLHQQEQPATPVLPVFQPLGTEDDIDAGIKRRPRTLTPMEMAQRQNQQLMNAYKARLARLQKKNPNYTNLNLTLHRKLAENMAIAQAREEALAKKMKERQKRLEEQAASRIVTTPGMSKDELERRHVYTKILEYEQDAKWPLSWRERLKGSPEDARLMQDLIKCILSYGDHPLTQMIAKMQTAIYKRLEPLCKQYIGDLEHIKVPYYQEEDVQETAQTDERTPSGLEEVSSTQSPHCTEIFPEVFENSKVELEHAMEANEKLVKQMTVEQEKLAHITDTGSITEIPEMDSDGSCVSRNEGDEAKLVEMKVQHLQQEALERHLQHIVKDIHAALDKVLTMFVVAYEVLDSPVGRDITYANIEEPVFKAIWPFLLSLFRFVNRKTEEKIALVMTSGLKLSPQQIGVKTKHLPPMTTPSAHEYPFSPAVAELCKLTTLTCPLSKLECIVRMVRTICHCVLEYEDNPTLDGLPSLGADDLLPILMFVIVRTSLPQLVSECHVLEEFVHEGYLMGEEGYCLTSLQTALSYMTRLKPQETLAF